MKFRLLKRNLLFLVLMSFYASCGREDIFEDRRDLIALTGHEARDHDIHGGKKMDEAQFEKIIQKRLALPDHAKYQRLFANALKASL